MLKYSDVKRLRKDELVDYHYNEIFRLKDEIIETKNEAIAAHEEVQTMLWRKLGLDVKFKAEMKREKMKIVHRNEELKSDVSYNSKLYKL